MYKQSLRLKILITVIIGILYYLFVYTEEESHEPMKIFHFALLGYLQDYRMMVDSSASYIFDGKNTYHPFIAGVSSSPELSMQRGPHIRFLVDETAVMHNMVLVWYSETENQFWRLEYSFDTNKLKELSVIPSDIPQYWKDNNKNLEVAYSVTLVPGGHAFIMLEVFNSKYFLGHSRATPILMTQDEWASFVQQQKDQLRYTIPKSHATTQDIYAKAVFNELSDELKKQINHRRLPVDGQPWLNYTTQFPMAFSIHSRHEVKYIAMGYINGERFEIFNQADYPFKKYGSPLALELELQVGVSTPLGYIVYFDEVKLFNTLYDYYKLHPDATFQFDFIIDSETGELTGVLKSSSGDLLPSHIQRVLITDYNQLKKSG